VDVKVLKTKGTISQVFSRFCAMYPNLGPVF
jgi:hypothetical protein